jgi:hypothetical protein
MSGPCKTGRVFPRTRSLLPSGSRVARTVRLLRFRSTPLQLLSSRPLLLSIMRFFASHGLASVLPHLRTVLCVLLAAVVLVSTDRISVTPWPMGVTST